jgi:hypothetical protein
MAYWGISYATGPNYNKQWKAFDPVDLKKSLVTAHDAAQRALELLNGASPVEQALIRPLEQRYPSNDPDKVRPIWNDHYADRMREVYRAYRDDHDIAALFAEAKSKSSTLSRLVRARLASLGLVVTCGFLLTVSLAVSAGLQALSKYLKGIFPGAEVALQVFDFIVSTALISGLFAAVYKVLPDKPITWRDVAIGALATTLLFEAGKYLIALYVGQSNLASSYGAAGALIVLLVWIYYTAQIFLLGAEFTHAFAKRHGSHATGKSPPAEERTAPR